MAEDDSDQVRRLSILDEERQHLAEKVRQDLGLEVEFERDLKKWFDAGVVEAYRQAMLPCIQKTRKDADLTLIAVALAKNDSLRGKWEKGEVQPSLDALLLAFAAFDVQVTDEDFPRGRVAVFRGIQRTMQDIAIQVLADDAPAPTREEFECVFASCVVPERLHSLHAGGARREKAAREIRADVSFQLKSVCNLSAEEIMRINGKWGIPWIIFQTLIPYDWRF